MQHHNETLYGFNAVILRGRTPLDPSFLSSTVLSLYLLSLCVRGISSVASLFCVSLFQPPSAGDHCKLAPPMTSYPRFILLSNLWGRYETTRIKPVI